MIEEINKSVGISAITVIADLTMRSDENRHTSILVLELELYCDQIDIFLLDIFIESVGRNSSIKLTFFPIFILQQL
jgi:hypothetical protein